MSADVTRLYLSDAFRQRGSLQEKHSYFFQSGGDIVDAFCAKPLMSRQA